MTSLNYFVDKFKRLLKAEILADLVNQQFSRIFEFLRIFAYHLTYTNKNMHYPNRA